MDSPRQSLQTGDVCRGRRSVVLCRLAPILTSEILAGYGQKMVDVVVFDFLVDIDVILVQDFGVVERLENGLLDDVWEERVLVWRLEAAD